MTYMYSWSKYKHWQIVGCRECRLSCCSRQKDVTPEIKVTGGDDDREITQEVKLEELTDD